MARWLCLSHVVSAVIRLSVDGGPRRSQRVTSAIIHMPIRASSSIVKNLCSRNRRTPRYFKLEVPVLHKPFSPDLLRCAVAMASKRAIQLFGARASVVAQQTPRLSSNVVRAFSLASRQHDTCTSQRGAAVAGDAPRLQVTPVQKRWHSQKPTNLNKVYQFEDVCYFLSDH